jgi:hypothetical protein
MDQIADQLLILFGVQMAFGSGAAAPSTGAETGHAG